MPKGPRGQKRPADVISNAVHVMKVLTGEAEETPAPDDGKDKAAQAMGRKGGVARARALSKKRRKEIASAAATSRWKSKK